MNEDRKDINVDYARNRLITVGAISAVPYGFGELLFQPAYAMGAPFMLNMPTPISEYLAHNLGSNFGYTTIAYYVSISFNSVSLTCPKDSNYAEKYNKNLNAGFAAGATLLVCKEAWDMGQADPHFDVMDAGPAAAIMALAYYVSRAKNPPKAPSVP